MRTTKHHHLIKVREEMVKRRDLLVCQHSSPQQIYNQEAVVITLQRQKESSVKVKVRHWKETSHNVSQHCSVSDVAAGVP